ncbi:MAG: hypothetical protein KA099_02715 [Alphaproteobacteria bacterium]|mgnify:CR=1 FL=1|nr:hypothetical protein [Alphaproteobacteria bacterium]MBP7759580.1 hypothetical protein [Alphaproteobacteria bacterium]MBP7762977.1 hypothetical protein [Alphaproteobacteria bacterium]MBP7904214.1 hypothetical protein [Alphaproteobacteria bacterium]
MPRLRKTLLTASLLLMSAAASGMALADNNNHHGGKWGGSENRDYGYDDHGRWDDDDDPREDNWREDGDDHRGGYDWNKRKHYDKQWDRYGGYNNRYDWRKAFDLHVPKRLKGTHARLPLLIVVDSRGNFRGVPSHRFYRDKAAREGFILAYTYSRNPYGFRRHEDDIVRSVLGLLDGHYRVNTNRINVRYD